MSAAKAMKISVLWTFALLVGVIAALSVAAPADRAGPAPLPRIRAAVIEAGRVVSRRLGAP